MSINPNTQYTLSGSQITDLRDYVQAAMESPSTLLGSTAPSSSTAADVGQLYLNTTNDKVYICTAKTSQGGTPETFTYTWEEVGGSGGSNITMSATDPGEGSALAADNYIAYYGGDPVVADYSTSEVNTGAKWVDGSAIYKKTFVGTALNAAATSINHGVGSVPKIINYSGYYLNSTSTIQPIPRVVADNNTGYNIGIGDVNGTSFTLLLGTSVAQGKEYAITIYYVKSS